MLGDLPCIFAIVWVVLAVDVDFAIASASHCILLDKKTPVVLPHLLAWSTFGDEAHSFYMEYGVFVQGGGGPFAVLSYSKPGRFERGGPLVSGHTASVLDFDFNPFHEQVSPLGIVASVRDCMPSPCPPLRGASTSPSHFGTVMVSYPVPRERLV